MDENYLLTRVQPALVGLIDGSLSTLAPIFAVALATGDPRVAFIAGLATSIGAAVSMGYSEALSDTGALTGRGRPLTRGLITGAATFLGGILHALPFLLPNFRVALVAAVLVVVLEIVAIAVIRARFFEVDFRSSLGHIALGGTVIVVISVSLGVAS